MHKYVIMGVQGSGKGTQAKLLCKRFDLVHISVGDIFRWNIQSHTKLAARIRRIVSDGQLVSDEIAEQIVNDRLDEHDWNYGFILDGFPRNHRQARFFLESYDIDAVIYIDTPDEVVTKRVMARRICSDCGLDYNLIHHWPAVEDECDVCGGELDTRPDDTPEALQKRLDDFHSQTKPVLQLFAQKELIVRVNGAQPADDVHRDVLKALGVSLPKDDGSPA